MSAAYPLFPHVVMSASAGTGKTFQLTNRYLSLINAGALPEQILAVTFTRKAAGEILDRLFSRLAAAATSPDTLTELQRHITGSVLDRGRCVELLKRLLRHLHRLRVSTLDSFFVQIAGVLVLELGLPVGWQIVEELDDQRLRAEAMRGLLAEDTLAEFVNLMRLLSKGKASRSVMALLASVANDLYDLSQQTAVPAWPALPRQQPLNRAALEASLHQIAASGFSDGRFSKARDADMAAASGEDWTTFVSKGLAGRIVAGEDTYYRKPIGSAVLDAYQPLIYHAQAVLLKQIADQNEATRRLLDRFGQAYQRLKLRHRALKFEDVTHVLAHTLTSTALDHIRYRLDTPIAHLLLDEFQDTSLTQWSAIWPFAERVTAQVGDSFFCVGDVKQAIYGWRGGVAELVDTVVGQLPNVAEEQLNCSYRSSQTVIDTVNTVFGRLAANPVLSPYPTVVSAWSRRFETHTTMHSDLPGHCRLVTAPAAHEVWAFDAEWVPDPVAGRVLYRLSDALTDREVVEEMWQHNGATEDDPMPYLKTILCRVVSIAAIIRRVAPDGEVKLFLQARPEHIESAADGGEAVLLSRFLTGVGQRKPQLVGFNSHAADLKIFIQRSIVQGIALPAFCARPDKPWEGKDYFARGSEWHIDLKDIVSGWGKTTLSLHELATLSDIPGKMMDVDGKLMDGKHVAEMWLDGDVKGIVQYNVRDALTTYLVWLRIAHFGGFFMEEAYCEEQERVRVLIAEKAQSLRYEHLLAYQEEWDRLTSIHTGRASASEPGHGC